MSGDPSRGRESRSLPEELSKLSEKGYNRKSSLVQPEFLAGLDAVSQEVRSEIADSLEKLMFKHEMVVPCHPDTKFIQPEEVWQLKVKGEHSDHRIYLDWHKKRQPVPKILSLFHADHTH